MHRHFIALVVFFMSFSWLSPLVTQVHAATRLYVQNIAAPYSPATKRGAWDLTTGFVDKKIGLNKTGTATTVGIAETSGTTNYDVLLARFVSDPLQSDTSFTTSDTVQWILGIKESSNSLNGYYHVHVYVTTGDSDTARGTLLTDNIGGTEFTTTATGRGEGAKTLSAVSALAGDRVVVEVGYQAKNTSTTSFTGTLNYGATGATDLVQGNTSVTTNPGWIEFSPTFQLKETTTLGDGVDPGSSAIAPGASATDGDAFTLSTDMGTDTVSSVGVTLAASTYPAITLVEITNDAGSTVYGSTSNPGSDVFTVTLTTPITVTTSSTQYHIRLTPQTNPNMPAPPGSTYSVTAKISTVSGLNTQTGSDTAGTTLTIDNTSPASVTSSSGSAGIEQVSLSWTNPADADFSQVVVLRRAGSAVGDTPIEGTTYSVGNTLGSSTVACVTGSTSCIDSGLTGGTSYHYKIFAKDSSGNYSSSGAVPTGSPVTPTAIIISVTVTSDGSISYGYMDPGTQKDTTSSGLNDTQVIKNDGNVAEDLTIKTSNAIGGTAWTLGATTGSDIFVHEFSLNGGGAWTKFTTADTYQSFVSNLGVNSTQNFDLRLSTPTSSTDLQQKTLTITILATQH